ncbi:MAG TPA: maleylpyruvate isomerase family mycothiol-dependent enzyme [Streptomyces sp.]|nr:maleylpyruvate isomerase family mycothiol-dependent enzyme [Streptomyces sp.]
MSRHGPVPGSPDPPGSSGSSRSFGQGPNRGGQKTSTDHAAIESLLAAWLVHACPPEEAAAVEAHLGSCERCTDEAHALEAVVAGLGGKLTRPGPPPGLYRRLTADAFARRPPVPRGLPDFVRPYAAQHATLDALLRELGEGDWRRETVEGWTVAQLLAHLAATDGLLAERIGAPPTPLPAAPGRRPPGPAAGPDDDTARRTAVYTAWAQDASPHSVFALWRAQGEALRAALAASGPGAGERRVSLDGNGSMPLTDRSLGRAFETWVHTADIALRTGHTLPPPVPESLTPIADLGVRLLPAATRVRGVGFGDRTLGVELTGPGGGAWLVGETGAHPAPAAGAEHADAHVALETVEFCFLAGGRRDPGQVMAAARVTGDRELVRRTLTAAPAFSRP